TFGGFSAGNIWRTADAGATWNDISGSGAAGLPQVPLRSIVIDPDYSPYLYVGSEVGIFTSEDSGATWSLPHEGPANVSVDELFWMDSNLIAATHGRGLFQTDLSKVSLSLNASPSPVEAGFPLTYTVEVENRAKLPLTDVTLSDELDPNTTFIEGSADCSATESGGIVTWSLGTLDGAQAQTCSFQVLTPSSGTILANSACVSSAEGPNACAVVETPIETAQPRSLQFALAESTVNEGEIAAIEVTLNKAHWQPVQVDYNSADGTAISDEDYTPTAGTLLFAPGEIVKTISLITLDDALYEGQETIDLALSAAGNADLGEPSTAVLTISDDETMPTVQFTTANFSVTEDESPAEIEVYLSGLAAQTITVTLASSDGTAVSGLDYTAVSTTLTFASGELIKTFPLSVVDDGLEEEPETINLALSDPSGAQPGVPVSAVVTIHDPQTTYTAFVPLAVKQ
ncbi:MAG: Calx-beta domain-containing protein, partial [Candidatus Promineifilaceae bacterium]|nr:Calx-beta domain-containing protein [Candidatus Promineifilaceae bacterium]